MIDNKRIVIGVSTREQQLSAVIPLPGPIYKPSITQGQYLNGILQGIPGEGTKMEPAYMKTPALGSRANGIFLN